MFLDLQNFFHWYIPPELEVKETTDTASSASFLDLYLEFDDSGQLNTQIYDKRDDKHIFENNNLHSFMTLSFLDNFSILYCGL
jgi:hypothetical protein